MTEAQNWSYINIYDQEPWFYEERLSKTKHLYRYPQG